MTPIAVRTDPTAEAIGTTAAPRSAVRRLVLTNYRSYRAAALEVDARPVVLTGPNGAGKTNLLESVSFLAPGRGLRRARLSAICHHALGAAETTPAPWAVAARVDTPTGQAEIGTGLDPTPSDAERRVARVDGTNLRGHAGLAEIVAQIWLTPRMDGLFLEGPSARRRFLDRLVFGLDPAHAGRVSGFERAMRERARLLKTGGDPAWMAALEDTMATRSVAIAAARRDLVARLARASDDATGPFPRAVLALTGDAETWLDQDPALSVEDRLRAALAGARARDAEQGGAAVGAHRCDLAARHAAHDRPAALCSTGEQKALLIAIVLANAHLQARRRGTPPVLLLDDVAAHLDEDRRAALFAEIEALGAQAWLTGTEPAQFEAWRDRAQFLAVADSVLTAT